MQILSVQRVGEAQHQGEVRVRSYGPPVRRQKFRHVITYRTHTNHINSGFTPALELFARRVITNTALVDLHILHTDTAEADD